MQHDGGQALTVRIPKHQLKPAEIGNAYGALVQMMRECVEDPEPCVLIVQADVGSIEAETFGFSDAESHEALKRKLSTYFRGLRIRMVNNGPRGETYVEPEL